MVDATISSDGEIRAAAHVLVRHRLLDRWLRWLLVVVVASSPLGLVLGGVRFALLPLPFALQVGGCLWLVRRGHADAAGLVFVAATVATLPVLLGVSGGSTGTGAPYCVVSALLAVVWLEPWAAVAAVVAHAAVLSQADHFAALAAAHAPGLLLHVPDSSLFASQALAASLCTGIVGAATDALLAAHREAEARTIEAADALAAATRSAQRKSTFLATMSHELRTPLTAILGYTEILLDDGRGPAGDLERIGHAGRHLLVLVDDLLELSRAESVRAPRVQEIDLPALLRSCQGRATVVLHGFDPFGVRSDEDQLRRVLRNLLGHVAPDGGRAEVVLSGTSEHVEVELRAGDRNQVADAAVGFAVGQRLAGTLGGTVRATPRGAVLILPRSLP